MKNAIKHKKPPSTSFLQPPSSNEFAKKNPKTSRIPFGVLTAVHLWREREKERQREKKHREKDIERERHRERKT